MKYVVFGDIHCRHNRLETLLNRASKETDKIFHIGDLFGGRYSNPIILKFFPFIARKVVETLTKYNVMGVAGNHDIESRIKHRHQLSNYVRDYLDQLKPSYELDAKPDIILRHELPGNNQFITSRDSLQSAINAIDENHKENNVIICGHTHFRALYSQNKYDDDDYYINLRPTFEKSYILKPDHKYILNVGSIVLPIRNLYYLLIDTKKREVLYQRV